MTLTAVPRAFHARGYGYGGGVVLAVRVAAWCARVIRFLLLPTTAGAVVVVVVVVVADAAAGRAVVARDIGRPLLEIHRRNSLRPIDTVGGRRTGGWTVERVGGARARNTARGGA